MMVIPIPEGEEPGESPPEIAPVAEVPKDAVY
jgi:hypothetical protein